LLCKVFSYTIDKTILDETYWECEDVRILKCKSRIHLKSVNTIILHENDNHNHPENSVISEIRIFEEKVRDRTINCDESTQTITDNYLTNLSENPIAHLPNFKHVKRNIQHRCGKNELPKILRDKTLDQIPAILSTTKRNTQFLQYDSGPGNDRLIIFSSLQQWWQLQENSVVLLVGGTFKVSIVCSVDTLFNKPESLDNIINLLSIVCHTGGLQKWCHTSCIRTNDK
jgi:hypothetical protein